MNLQKIQIYTKIVLLAFFGICICVTVDTNLFVYPSLSRSLLMEIGVLFLSVMAIMHFMSKRYVLYIDSVRVFLLIWIFYVLMHGHTVSEYEEYRTYYLAISLLAILTLSYLIEEGIITHRNLENGLLSIVFIHLFFIVCQFLGLIDSGNPFFSITGSNENPTVTAIFLVCSIPLIISRIKLGKNLVIYGIGLLILLISIVNLKCRTAYIGLFVETIVWLLVKYCHSLHKIHFKWLVLPIIITFTAFASVKLYNMKRDSADSRLLIWKLSAEMIKDKPGGFGYGMYERNYNIHQSQYFRTSRNVERERGIASHIAMAYNDYLEQGVEGGIVGMILLSGFYVLIIWKAHSVRNIEALCVVCALAIMSLFNFVYSSIQPWWLLVCYSSLVISNNKFVKVRRNVAFTLGSIICVLLAVGMYRIVQMTSCQLEIRKYYDKVKNGEIVNDATLFSLQPYIGSSEAFWNLCAYNYINKESYREAIVCANQACRFTSSPSEYEMRFYACMQLKEDKEAIQYMDTLNLMSPRLLRPKSILMDYYAQTGNVEKALIYANEIQEIPPKTNNTESKFIRDKALNIIKLNRPEHNRGISVFE